jgi:hypothetical protein
MLLASAGTEVPAKAILTPVIFTSSDFVRRIGSRGHAFVDAAKEARRG